MRWAVLAGVLAACGVPRPVVVVGEPDDEPDTGAGPVGVSSCDLLSDRDVLSIVYDEATPKAPTRLLGAELLLQPRTAWIGGCALDGDDAARRAATWFEGWDVGAVSSYSRFFAVGVRSGPTSVLAALPRCEYYDRAAYGGAREIDDVRTFAAFHWWLDHAQTTGDWLLTVQPLLASTGDVLQRCQLRTVYGDFGVSDEITIELQDLWIADDGDVEQMAPVPVRTVIGRSN